MSHYSTDKIIEDILFSAALMDTPGSHMKPGEALTRIMKNRDERDKELIKNATSKNWMRRW
jgi:hypothetical protein